MVMRNKVLYLGSLWRCEKSLAFYKVRVLLKTSCFAHKLPIGRFMRFLFRRIS